MNMISKLPKNSSKRARRILRKTIMLPVLFLLLCIPVFAHYYSLSPSSTTNGGGTWGAILRMTGSISGDNVTFTVQKTSGTFSITNSVYLKVGTYEPYGVNRATGTIYAGGSQWSHTHNLSAYTYPKQFYFRVESTDGYAWVGPITVYYNNSNPYNHTVLSEPTSGNAGQSLTYSYRISDPDNDRVKIHISWGDGSSTWDSGLRSSGSTVSCSHTYGSAGTYNLYTTVFDEHGASSSTRYVQVNISEVVPSTPSTPTVTATGPTSVYIYWNSVPGAAKYTVWRSTSAYGTYKQIYCSSPTNYTDSGSHLSPNTTYFYKIRAGNNAADCANPNSSGWSGYSSYASAKTEPDGPPKPNKPTVTATGPTSIKISWNPVDGAAKYTVWRSTSPSGTYKQIYCSSPTSYTDSGSHLSPGTTYYYKIRSGYSHADCADSNSSGWSEYSDYNWDTTITEIPTAAFYGTPTSGTAPLTVQFYDQSTAGSGASISSWHWEFGDGTTSSDKNPSHTYNSSGTYTVKLTVTDSYNNVDTETKSSYITVSPPTPTAGFYGTPTSGNAPLTVQFYDQSQAGEGASITLWYWDFGDGTTGSGKNPTHTYNNPGIYDVKLTVQNSSGYEDSETKTDYITVTEPASTITAGFYGDPTYGEAPLTVQFYDQSSPGSGASITSWQWNFGDGKTSSSKNPSHQYTSPGTYTVTLKVTDSKGSQATETKTSYITVNSTSSTPTADFYGTPTSGEAPLTVQFYDQSSPGSNASITSWQWNFGDGKTSSSENPSHQYTSPGTYTVTLTVTNSKGSQATKTKNSYITVSSTSSTPTANFYGTPTTGKVPLNVQFYDQSSPGSGASITSWQWNFGDGKTSSSENPSHQYTSPGTYSVTLTVTNSKGNQATKTKNSYITVNSTSSTPTANFSGIPTSGSAPLTVQFYDQSTPGSDAAITSRKWDFGDGKTSSNKNPTHTYNSQGNYTVKLTVTNSFGNSNTITKKNYIKACNNCLLYRLPFPGGINMGITNGYGDELHTGKDHYCVDFNLTGESDAGIPVLAAANGKVTYAQYNTGGYGFRVVVDHGNGITSNYSHGASINVSVGEFVEQGQELMVIWDTGTGGYHLHFGMRKNNEKLELKNFSGCPSGCTFDPKNAAGYTSDNVINNPGKIIEENKADISGSIDGNESYYGHDRKYSWKYAVKGTSTTTVTYRPRFSQKVTCDIFVYIPPFNATTTAAKYKVKHIGGSETFTVNQLNVPANSSRPNNWVRLGNKTFEFGSGSNYYVQVGNGVDTLKKDDKVGFDAVYFKINESGGGVVPTGTPKIGLNRTTFNFGAIASGPGSDSAALFVNNTGKGTLNWTANSNASWLNISPKSGTNSGTINISVNSSSLAAGTYTGKITISDPDASNSPRNVSVTLKVHRWGWTGSPFGDFSTPTNNSTVRSSVPVTGWALDDVGIASVKIYNGSKYIGDAVFVEGARPDIEQAYPDYPMNSKAGWGYMLLTNFLPNGGNGQYVIYARATDKEGNSVTLGNKTIYCDNGKAFKPFGAIDTPTQGGTASGRGFINWGWVLTPQPNYIPTDGSTIKVYVDGVNIGHPLYNIYRADIANLFPGYANSSGAIGYYTLDTTAYKNGIHTIQWIASDSAGNTDGIGSRYFTIQNTGTNGQRSSVNNENQSLVTGHWSLGNERLSSIPIDNFGPVIIEKGFNRDTIPGEIYPDENGDICIETRETERVVIDLGCPQWRGYHLIGEQLKPLPVGSTLDAGTGIFYWQPGPGFIGEYQLVFITRAENGEFMKKTIKIFITPKFKK